MIWIMTKDGWKQFEAPAIPMPPPIAKEDKAICWQNSPFSSYKEWLEKTL